MGILDFFRRNRNKDKSNSKINEEIYPEMQLDYRDGTRANIKFKEVIDYVLENGKSAQLQTVEIEYLMGSRFEIRKYYIDPVAMMDENGNWNYDSATYFENLKRSNLGLVKAFFKKDELSKLPSNYIGNLAIYQDGRNPSRNFNQEKGFYSDYISEYKRKMKEKQEVQLNLQAENFQKEMRAMSEKTYEINYKDSHAEVLTPKMREEVLKNYQR